MTVARHRAEDRSAEAGAVARHHTLERIARGRLARVAERRDVARLSAAGKTQREIADALATTEPQVGRTLRAIELLGDPSEETAEELIMRAFLVAGDRDELVEQLSSRSYTASEYAPYPAEGKRSGTWEQVRHAYMSGFISEDEFDQIKSAAQVD